MNLTPCCVANGENVSSAVGQEPVETPRQMPYHSKGDCDNCLKKIKDYVIIAVKVCATVVGSVVAFFVGVIVGGIVYPVQFMINRSKHYDKHHSPEEITKRDKYRCLEIDYHEKIKTFFENAKMGVLEPLTLKEIEELETETSYDVLYDDVNKSYKYLKDQLLIIRNISHNRVTRTIDEEVLEKYTEVLENLGSLESAAEGEKVGIYEFERKLNNLVRWSDTLGRGVNLEGLVRKCDDNIAAIQHMRDKHKCAACCHFCNHPIVEKIPSPIRGIGFGIVTFIPFFFPCGFVCGGGNSVRMWFDYVWGFEPRENQFPWRSRYPFGDGNTL